MSERHIWVINPLVSVNFLLGIKNKNSSFFFFPQPFPKTPYWRQIMTEGIYTKFSSYFAERRERHQGRCFGVPWPERLHLCLIVLLIILQDYIFVYLKNGFIFAFPHDSCWVQFELSLDNDWVWTWENILPLNLLYVFSSLWLCPLHGHYNQYIYKERFVFQVTSECYFHFYQYLSK